LSGINHHIHLTWIEQGAIFTWGSCSFGRLGHGFVEEICWRPTRIVGAENMIFKSLAIGHYHMVAVTGTPELTIPNSKGKPKEQSTGQAFKSDLKRLLGMPEVSDITISINQNLFKLHSPILR
jgi:alpha-tubulin suppressor-like RCC1 family protein